MAAELCETEVFQEIFNCAKVKLTREDVNKLLLAIDNYGWTFLHFAARYGKQEAC
jgi:ankyrin repeat protein